MTYDDSYLVGLRLDNGRYVYLYKYALIGNGSLIIENVKWSNEIDEALIVSYEQASYIRKVVHNTVLSKVSEMTN